jgi:hypothetical protein
LIVLLTSRKFRRLALASSDALPQKGFAWTMLTSPLFSSKPSLHWSVFSPVGIWLPDRAENWRSVFWGWVMKLVLSNLGLTKAFSEVGRLCVGQFVQFFLAFLMPNRICIP